MDGTLAKSIGKIMLMIHDNGQARLHEFEILEKLVADAIIGMDLLIYGTINGPK